MPDCSRSKYGAWGKSFFKSDVLPVWRGPKRKMDFPDTSLRSRIRLKDGIVEIYSMMRNIAIQSLIL
jgi:hypothetical protein